MTSFTLCQVRLSSAGSCARYFQKLLTSSTRRVRLISSNTARTCGLASRYSIGVRGIIVSGAVLALLVTRRLWQAPRAGTIGQTATATHSGTRERAMPKTPDYFAGKTILITGAASGIGRATALIFAREGANVVCADINEQGARDTAATVNGAGSQALALKTDVTSREQVNDTVARTVAAFGAVQFLFNSAGAAIRRAKFLEIDDALIDKTFALNVSGTFYAMQAVLPHMLKNRHGVIVNMASMAHRRGGPGSSIQDRK